MLKIEKEDFGKNIGRIIYWNNHYYYGGHDSGWTRKNCGLYAMKRLLFVLGKHDEVNKGLWYRFTDSQLRELDLPANQDENIPLCLLRTLMNDLGVPAIYNKIYDKEGDDISTGGDAMTPDESITYWTRRLENLELSENRDVDQINDAKKSKEQMEEFKIKHTNNVNRLLNR
ncbi:hypothetical protein AGMMS49593_07920 [Endomicrobiia bacterium]|nr:hypothetical protein AGMMS49593_07920 [Endomicrobiia bacterium]